MQIKPTRIVYSIYGKYSLVDFHFLVVVSTSKSQNVRLFDVPSQIAFISLNKVVDNNKVKHTSQKVLTKKHYRSYQVIGNFRYFLQH